MIRYRNPTLDFHQPPATSNYWNLMFLWSLVLAVCSFCDSTSFAAESSPRQRLSFNSDWLFIKGDPTNSQTNLDYQTPSPAKLDYQILKPWLLPIGAHLTTNAQPASRPSGNPGTNVPYAQASFDDSHWRKLNLPHDWGIEGPFKQEYPGETGKLPWWGIGWYRKHFTITPDDAGKHISLEIDG